MASDKKKLRRRVADLERRLALQADTVSRLQSESGKLNALLRLLHVDTEIEYEDSTRFDGGITRRMPALRRLVLPEPLERLLNGHVSSLDQDGFQAGAAPERDCEPEGFRDWWLAQVDQHAAEIERKSQEYGSNSLAQVGYLIARAQKREVSEAEALEIGCAVYAFGKLERVVDSMLVGKLPSEDTWHDLQVYAAMAKFIRQTGSWG